MGDVIKEHVLNISGNISIPESLKFENEIDIACRGVITSIKKKDNNDGSFNFKYQFRPTGECIINTAGKKIIGKDKGRLSVKLRGALWHYHIDKNIEEDFEKWRDKIMMKLICNVSTILEGLK